MSDSNHFDAKAATWDDDPVKLSRTRAIADAIRRLVPLSPSTRALEYGCGTGALSFALRPGLGPITLADTSLGMLDVLRAKIEATGASAMRPIRLDLASDPLPPERFDLIYTAMTFHHIEDTAAMLRVMCSLLEPGGALCVADLDAEDGSFHGHEPHVHKGFDRDELAWSAREAGFQNIEFTTAFTMTKGAGPAKTDFPIFLMVARKASE